MRGAARACAPTIGHIAQSRPSSDIAIVSSPAGLLRLRRFDGEMGTIGQSGAVPVRIERAE
ncbi:conserved hypothetical protein [Citreicella sp. SE45]|nr:conserved hypothetical protein [Citreicella sp. SE45]